MNYHKALKFCYLTGAWTGIISASTWTLANKHYPKNKIARVLDVTSRGYQGLICCLILILNFDFILQNYPNSNDKRLSDWILNKGKDLAFVFMGSGLIISSFLLRKSIRNLYSLMNEYSLQHSLKMRDDFKFLNTCSLILVVLHSGKVAVSEMYDMLGRQEETKFFKRLLIPSDPEINWDAFYAVHSLNSVADIIQILHQGYTMMFLVVGAAFISDAFRSLQVDFEQEIQLSASFFSHFALAAKLENSRNSQWSLQSNNNNVRAARLQQKWDKLVEIFELYSFIGGVYLCIMFPGVSLGFVTRVASGILNTFRWNWSTYGSRVYSGMICLMRTLLLIEVGHKFKSEVGWFRTFTMRKIIL